MFCPSCKKNLNKAILSGVEVDYCPKCLGLWFEEQELRWAKDYKDRNLRWLDIDLWKDKEKFKVSRAQKFCPACRLLLYEINYGNSDILVDVCNLCHGVWLDRGEFKKITRYLKQKADYEILRNFAKNLTQEFWEIFTGPETLREEIEDFLIVLKLLNYKFTIQHPNLSRIILSLPK